MDVERPRPSSGDFETIGLTRRIIPNRIFMKAAPKTKKALSAEQREELLETLQARFEKHMSRHPGVEWSKVKVRLEASPEKLWSLQEMESTGGEPDVLAHDKKTGDYLFIDCAAQSPKGRTSLCYDREALDSRKEFKPKNNAMDLAAAMGIELLTEEQYHELQQRGEFDTKSSSWLKTPTEIRKLGGAIFGDRRFGRVFVYHNGAESYYSGRGFRGWLKI
jgi:class 3 adenylate cyclase